MLRLDGRRKVFFPVLGDINAPANPDLVVRLHVIEKFLQAAQPAEQRNFLDEIPPHY